MKDLISRRELLKGIVGTVVGCLLGREAKAAPPKIREMTDLSWITPLHWEYDCTWVFRDGVGWILLSCEIKPLEKPLENHRMSWLKERDQIHTAMTWPPDPVDPLGISHLIPQS